MKMIVRENGNLFQYKHQLRLFEVVDFYINAAKEDELRNQKISEKLWYQNETKTVI